MFKPRVWAKQRPGSIQVNKATSASGVARPVAFDRWNPGLQAADADAANVLAIYDPIGEDFWSGTAITAKTVSSWLATKSGLDIEVHINSPGGDMFEGIAIYNLLQQHTGHVEVKVIGLAASAASIIAMAGDEVLMGDAAFLMIHKCSVMAFGNDDDMLETAVWLKPFDAAMAGVYAARTGQNEADCMTWMSAASGDGTYFGAAKAIELGFADGTISADQVKENVTAKADGKKKSDLLKVELALCAQMPRSEARALLNRVKSKPDAALKDDTKPDAGGDNIDWLGAAAGLLATISSKG